MAGSALSVPLETALPSRPRRPVRPLIGVAAVVIATLGWVPPAPAAANCSPNPVVCENSRPGTPPEVWDIDRAGDETIQGYATDISVNVGGSIDFKIDTTATAYTIDLYRLGWYGGLGARKVDSVPAAAITAQQQDDCYIDPTTEIYDCGNWAVSASWTVPSTAVSGVYVARLTRTDDGGASHITFVVRDDSSTSAVFFQTSDTTWHAYNDFGGSNFYHGGGNGRAYKLSYNRPFATRNDNYGRDFLFSNEYPMIRFLERNGYDVSYTSGVDSDRRGHLIRNHDLFLSIGHDEYWSGTQRANVEAARDAGVHLAFFAGNEVYWKTRWESAQDGSGTPFRTMVCYKESWADAKIDPSQEWTGTWRDPRFSPPANGGRPENALVGTAYIANDTDLALQVPAEQGRYRFWRGTSVAALTPGQTATLAPHTIGYESNEDLDNGFRPPGLIRLSTTVGTTPEYLRDFGREVSPGQTTHHLTLYRATSGALVFSAGTIQWAWGLDSVHDGVRSPADPAMQQATMNLFADMGILPATTMAGMQTPTPSGDNQPPTVQITSPAAGATVASGTSVTVTGTATDAGGGRVAAVEVSTDGSTWRRAEGTTAWSYTFPATGAGSTTIRVRAIDDSVNIAPSPATRVLALTGATSLFGDRAPKIAAVDDSGAYQLGVRFTPTADGYVTGVRFHKGPGNTGTHTGTLWSSGGTRLATGTFTGETAGGWQTMTFDQRVPVNAGTTYVASYFAPNGHYSADPYFFSYHDHVAPPLVAPRDDNGVYAGGDNFPHRTHQSTNYHVDVLFLDRNVIPPAILSVSPARGTAGVAPPVTPTVTFSKAVTATSVALQLTGPDGNVPGQTAYNPTARRATFTPAQLLAAGQRYTMTVAAADAQNQPLDPALPWSFRTDPYPELAKLFPNDALPAVTDSGDTDAVTLGVKFSPATAGSVVGIRYYKSAANTGTHTGGLWTVHGVRLGEVTFADEESVGWQTATFTTPIAVQPGTTYVVSYHAPHGRYAVDTHFFANDWTRGALSAPAGGNGLYRYGPDGFPASTFADANYWVDPVFAPGLVPDPGPDPTPTPTPAPGPEPEPDPAGTVSLFPVTAQPANPSWDETASIEVGVRFRSDVDGTVEGMRFHKGAGNTGPHTGTLWSAGGQVLATGVFTGETATGWQRLIFDSPVAVTAGTTYVLSYSTTTGHYAADAGTFAGEVVSGPLRVPALGGTYRYGGGFPEASTATNFWVDVLLRPSG